MKRLDLAQAKSEHPEYSVVWDAMAAAAPRMLYLGKYLDPRAVARKLRRQGSDAVLVVFALNALVRDGSLKQVYVIINPNTGEILSKEYPTPSDVPEEVFDFERRVSRDEFDVVPLYKSSDE